MKLEKKEIEMLIKDKLKDFESIHGKAFKTAIIEIISLEKMLHPDNMDAEKEEKLIELSKWNEHYDYPTVGSLRQSYFRRKENGFESCVEYGGDNGGRILINVEKFREWRKSRKQIKLQG